MSNDDGISAEVQRMIQEAQAMMTEEVMEETHPACHAAGGSVETRHHGRRVDR
jgi:hypothetical protein